MEKKRNGINLIKLLFIFIMIISFKFNKFFLELFFRFSFEMKSIENYFRICNNGKLINKKQYKQNKFPKISIISPVYNREEFILRFLRSIQNQKFNDIEIIFIDDYSEDNSVKIIEKYQEKEKRIILIKNKKVDNSGWFTTLFSSPNTISFKKISFPPNKLNLIISYL